MPLPEQRRPADTRLYQEFTTVHCDSSAEVTQLLEQSRPAGWLAYCAIRHGDGRIALTLVRTMASAAESLSHSAPLLPRQAG